MTNDGQAPIAGQAEPAGNTPAPSAAPVTAIPSPAEPLAAGLTHEHKTILSGIDADEASGAMSKEQAQQARREVLGHEPTPDGRTSEEIAFDSTWPAARPEAYSFPRYESENLTAEQKAADLG